MTVSERIHRTSKELAFSMLPKKQLNSEKITQVAQLLNIAPKLLSTKIAERNIAWLTGRIEKQKPLVLQTLKNLFKKDRNV